MLLNGLIYKAKRLVEAEIHELLERVHYSVANTEEDGNSGIDPVNLLLLMFLVHREFVSNKKFRF